MDETFASEHWLQKAEREGDNLILIKISLQKTKLYFVLIHILQGSRY
jgi:hypothetical protein